VGLAEERVLISVRYIANLLYPFWLETRLIPSPDHPHPFGFVQDRPNLPPSRAVRGRFLSIFGLEAYDYSEILNATVRDS
jgi:hypothetical protein